MDDMMQRFLKKYTLEAGVATFHVQHSITRKISKNSGIRAGRIMTIETAAGRSRASASQGNIVQIGPYKLTDAEVGVNDRLDRPLLGMDVLNRFQITQSNGMITLRANW